MLVVFDFDGVLVDTVNDLMDVFRDSVYQVLPDYDPEYARKIYDERKGIPIEEVCEELFGKKAHLVLKEYRIKEKPILDANKTFKGAERMLSQLKEKGHTLAISTSTPTSLIKKRVEVSGLSEYFDENMVVGYNPPELKKGKKHIEYLLEESGESKHVMFDDGVESVKVLKEDGVNAFQFGQEIRSYSELIEKVEELSK